MTNQSTKSATDAAVVSVYVSTNPLRAFEIFTADIDRWWKRDTRIYRTHPERTLVMERQAGGRFLDVHPSDGSYREIGKILTWVPGEELVFEWRGVNFKPQEVTEVAVRFVAENTGTRVTLTHSGWDQLPIDHAAKHNQPPRDFIRTQANWLARLMEAFMAYVTNNDENTDED